MGLSVTYSGISAYERSGVLFDRVLSLIRAGPGGPMLLRIGGMSADRTYWRTATTGSPRWVSEIDDGWLTRLTAVARRNHIQVMLDLNLAVHSPRMAAGLARAARNALPGQELAGLAVGNEPDLYRFQPGLERERIGTTIPSTPRHWARNYSPSDYRRDYRAYARALVAAAPGIPLAAPDSASYNPDWLEQLGDLGRLSPRIITIHRYASSTCWPKQSPYYPTVPSLLAERSSAGLAMTVNEPLAIARSAGLALWVTEFNSVSCGGQRNVADSFATALWVPDALFELLQYGVDRVSLHLRTKMANAPFQITAQGVQARPELYGLALFAQMIGPHAQLERTRLVCSPRLHLKAWAVRSQARLSVLLINKGPRPANVRLRAAAAHGPALLERLGAPSVASQNSVTLAGRWIGPDAEWHGPQITASIPNRGGAYRLLVPGYSAALLTFGHT